MLPPVFRCSQSRPRLVPDWYLLCSAYIVAHRGKDLDKLLATGLLEVEWVNLSFAICCFKIGIPGKGPVSPEFFRSLYGDFRGAGRCDTGRSGGPGFRQFPAGRTLSGIFSGSRPR